MEYGERAFVLYSPYLHSVYCFRNTSCLVIDRKLPQIYCVIIRAAIISGMDLQRSTPRNLMSTPQEQYRTIFENTGTAMVLVGKDAIIALVNSMFCTLVGLPKQEIEGKKKWTDFVHADDKERMQAYFWQRAHDPASVPSSYEFRLVDHHGNVHDVYATVTMIPGSESRVASLIDITDRKRAELKLREQAALLNFDPDAIIVRDLEDRVTFWSDGAERMYGWEPGEVLGKSWKEIQPNLDRTQHEAAWRQLREQGRWRGELEHQTKDGKRIDVQSSWTLVRDEHDNPKAVYIVNTNISESKELQKRFLRLQRLESIGTLAGGIAHDLNNILVPIILGTQILRKSISDGKSRNILDMIESSARRGAEMVKQVLTFARGTEGEHVTLQPRHLLLEMEQITRKTFPKSIEVRIDVPKDLWTIVGDATQLHQVLLNLCVNARDAMEDKGGTLRLSAENIVLDEHFVRLHPDAKVGPHVVLSVSDTGTGIPPEIMEKIFEPFFTTKSSEKGTGLGLSTTIGIVKSHGGFISVYSEPGRGTTFKVYLPAAASPEIVRAERERAENLPPGHGETILFVDDEISLREITRATLVTFGYEVVTAADGTEAVALYAQHKETIAAVVCDVMMPHMDGIATLRALQKINPAVKVILVSGFLDNQKLAEVMTSQSIHFIQKPYTSEKLLVSLDEVLHR